MVANLKAKNKVVGIKQVKRALTSQEVEILYIADDVDKSIKDEILNLAIDKRVPIVELNTMEELGNACGIDVGAATAALLKNTNNN